MCFRALHGQTPCQCQQRLGLLRAPGKAGVLGWWPSRAVTFLDNHDTGSTQAHWPFPAQYLHQARLNLIKSQPADTQPTSGHSCKPYMHGTGSLKPRRCAGLCIHIDAPRDTLHLSRPSVDRRHAEAQPLAPPALAAPGAHSTEVSACTTQCAAVCTYQRKLPVHDVLLRGLISCCLSTGWFKQVQALQGGASLSSGSLLQPLRNTIYDLIKLRRRLEIHADSQVLSQSCRSRRAKQGMPCTFLSNHTLCQLQSFAGLAWQSHKHTLYQIAGSCQAVWVFRLALMPEQC